MTTLSNRISVTLTPTDLDRINKAMEALEKQLTFLVSLDDGGRKELHQVGDMSREFIRKALVAAKTHPDALPRFFDTKEFAKDVELSEALYPLLLSVRRLYNSVEDTHALAQSEAYEAALVVYRSARDNDTGRHDGGGDWRDEESLPPQVEQEAASDPADPSAAAVSPAAPSPPSTSLLNSPRCPTSSTSSVRSAPVSFGDGRKNRAGGPSDMPSRLSPVGLCRTLEA
jgi:hypothetical protein